jgi:threonine aldolase
MRAIRLPPVSRDFRSDNTYGVSPEIFEALRRVAGGTMTSYGGDAVTARVRERCRELFETDLEVFPVVSGTAGNALAIAAMTTASDRVFCHEDAHIVRDEQGAPEFFTGGATLVAVPGGNGKLAPDRDFEGTLSITQATEAGTIYAPDEVHALAQRAKGGVHMDGARFANAIAALGCRPADVTWRAGVDILVFGATKNGAMAAELIVVFRRELSDRLALLQHRSGHRLSKTRFLSAQFEAYLTDDLWLRNARRANAAAARLAAGIQADVLRPVEANVVFVRLAPQIQAELRAQGFQFHEWTLFGPDAVRLVTAFDTSGEDVDALIAATRAILAP